MILVSGIAITLLAGFVISVGEANGQNQSKYMNENEVQMILGYCYLHADRPNPVQDLVDKGLVSSSFKGYTCGSVKQGYDQVMEQERQDKIKLATLEQEIAECAYSTRDFIQCYEEGAEKCVSIMGYTKCQDLDIWNAHNKFSELVS